MKENNQTRDGAIFDGKLVFFLFIFYLSMRLTLLREITKAGTKDKKQELSLASMLSCVEKERVGVVFITFLDMQRSARP